MRSELARVLRPGAVLIVYTDAFHGRLVDRASFSGWLTGTYLPSLPAPARRAYFDPDLVQAHGFDRSDYTQDDIHVPLTRTQLADYLLSQSNAAMAIESGHFSAEALRARIIAAITPFLPDDDPVEAVFGVRVWTTIRSATAAG